MAQESKEDRYSRWKSLIPVLYDWLTNHNLIWPSLSCRWGPMLEQGAYKNYQRLYISEQTIEKYPNTLVVANCEVVKPRVAAAEHISQFNEEAKSPFIKKHKTIIHPGEVNRIREMPQNSKIVATHTDSSEVLIWNVETQPNRTAHVGAAISKPDLILTGHADNAEYALALSSTAPFILSGGKDKQVLLWSIEDHVPEFREPSPLKPATPGGKPKLSGFHLPASDPTKIGPRGQFRGHSMTVEDVQFRPLSTEEFCSVGDDACLILWDARIGSEPAIKVESAHDSDVHCVDWNTHDDNYILTGSADMSVRLFDRRKISAKNEVGAPVEIFEGHTAAVLCVQWCPDGKSIFGSSADDGILNIWDFEKVSQAKQEGKGTKKRAQHAPPGLFFQHAGHRYKVVDFHWDPVDPWTVVSVSDDCEGTSGGGTLQIWRMNDLIYRPEKEVLEELEKYRDQILGGKSLNL